MTAEKRLNTRAAVRLLADVAGKGGEACLYGRVTDLSLRGAFIEGLRGFTKGSRCELTLLFGSPEDGPKARVDGLVTRAGGSGIGVRFEHIDAAGLPHLIHLLLSLKHVRPQVVKELDEMFDFPPQPRGHP